MAKRKRVFRGWIAKMDEPGWSPEEDIDHCVIWIYRRKGKACDWHPDKWPPEPVKVTMEWGK